MSPPINFQSPQEQSEFGDYMAQVREGLANYGMSDPFDTGAPTISTSGSVGDWFSTLAGSVQKGITATPIFPGGIGPTIGQIGSTAKTAYNVGAFLTDIPRLLITITGFMLIIFGLMVAALRNPGVQEGIRLGLQDAAKAKMK